MRPAPVSPGLIRKATPEDMPRIRELHAQTEQLVGMKMDLPEVGDSSLIDFWVVERDGRVMKFMYLEKCTEYVEGGIDPLSAQAVWRFREELFSIAARKGARYVHSLIPPALDGWTGKLLFRFAMFLTSRTSRLIGWYLKETGFKKTGMVHYNRRLR